MATIWTRESSEIETVERESCGSKSRSSDPMVALLGSMGQALVEMQEKQINFLLRQNAEIQARIDEVRAEIERLKRL